MKHLVIIQPYLPRYRVPFFDGLIAELRTADIDCRLVCGTPGGEQQARDDGTTARWASTSPSRSVRVGPAKFSRIAGKDWMTGADGVIVGLQATLADVYEAFYMRRRTGVRVGLWGHVKSYVRPPNAIDQWLERRLIRSADHIFAYTPGGTEEALAAGVPDDQVTTVMNTIDTDDLVRVAANLTHDEISAFRLQHRVPDYPCLAYVGGLDESKRIDFLADSLDHLWQSAPQYRILLAGQGDQLELLRPALNRGQAVHLGYADTATKARLLRVAHAVLMPGRIGLIAVDCLALRVPILTSLGARHAPEAEYLREGSSVFISPNDPKEFAHLIETFTAHTAHPITDLDYPNLSTMIRNFADGVERMLRLSPPRRADRHRGGE